MGFKNNVFILFSGGIDSSACIIYALKNYKNNNIIPVFFNYGQKNLKYEYESMESLCKQFNLTPTILDIDQIFKNSNSSLVTGVGSNYELYFRNIILISVLINHILENYDKDVQSDILIGATQGGYVDTSLDFLNRLNDLINVFNYKIQLIYPFIDHTKIDVVKYLLESGLFPINNRTCYSGEAYECGNCPACIDKINAFKFNNIDIWTNYNSYDNKF